MDYTSKAREICKEEGLNYDKLPERLKRVIVTLLEHGLEKEVRVILREYREVIMELLKYTEKEEYYGMPGAYIYVNIGPP